MSAGVIRVHRLGRVEYADGLELQRLFGEARAQDAIPDSLLLLEHPPVITLGRSGKPGNILAPGPELERLGVKVFETNRGGDVTYHGPGQLVGYPIFKLLPGKQDVRKFVRRLEEAMIRVVGEYGLQAVRIPEWTGVWLGEGSSARKIGAIGVHFARWQSSHGFALNVNTDLAHFAWIVPCGIREAAVTSLQKELGHPVAIDEVAQRTAQVLGELFEAPLEAAPPPLATVSVAVATRRSGQVQVLLLRRTAARGGFWQIVTGRVEAGEAPAQAAARELEEETGLRAKVVSLGYQHCFALGTSAPPQVVQETGFAAWVETAEVRLDPAEHDAHQWVSVPEARERLPFEGLRESVRRTVG